MIPVLVPVALAGVGVWLKATNRLPKWQPALYWLICLYSICVFGFRGMYGLDTVVLYAPSYDEMPTFGQAMPWQVGDRFPSFAPGFVTVMMAFKSLGLPFLAFQLAVSIFLNVTVFWFFKKYTPYYLAAILLFFASYAINFNIEILRQDFCICLMMFAYSFYKRRSWAVYYLLSLLALTFHMAAILMFALPLMVWFDIRFGRRLVVAILVAMGASALIWFFAPDLFAVLGSTYHKKMEFYMHPIENCSVNYNFVIYNLLINFVLPLFFLWVARRVNKGREPLFSKIWCAYIILGACFIFFGEAVNRLNMLIVCFYLGGLADSLGRAFSETRACRNISIAALGMFLVCYGYFPLKRMYLTKYHYPYNTVFSDRVIDPDDHPRLFE